MASFTPENLHEIFKHHIPTKEQVERYARVRVAAESFAAFIMDNCPDTPERTLALRDVQRAMMMANASIALAHIK